MKYIKKADIIFISMILISIGITCLFIKNDSETVVISVKGEKYGEYSLYKYQEININDTNTLKIDETGAYMIYADCPDKICMTHYKLNSNLGAIVCLPNQVIVNIEGATNFYVDVIS